jgi:hypothetical protein
MAALIHSGSVTLVQLDDAALDWMIAFLEQEQKTKLDITKSLERARRSWSRCFRTRGL